MSLVHLEKNFIDQACGEEIHRHALHARVIFSARRVNIRHFVYLMFNFCNRKIALFADENIALFHLKRKKKPNLSELTEVFCGLLSLLFKYFLAKMKCIGTTLIVISCAAIVWSRHTMPSISRWRESTLRDETK